jgi:hypothetical protein
VSIEWVLEGAGIGAVGFGENVDSSCKKNVKKKETATGME